MVTLVKLVQSEKTYASITVIPSGIKMLVNLLQPSKARASMLDIPSGKRISVKLVQLEKAEFPMLVALWNDYTAECSAIFKCTTSDANGIR